MPSREYHEGLWRDLPEGLQPPGLQLRRSFLLEHVGAGERVLDVGCGEGLLASELCRAGVDVIGIDVAEEPLARGRRRDSALELALVDGEGPWELPDAHFDVVWAGEVIEHIADTAAWLSEVRRVLRSGGALLLSTPAHGLLTRMRLALSGRTFAEHFDPRGDHLRFYTKDTLRGLLEDFGFREVEVREVRGGAGAPGARRTLLARAIRSRF